MSKTKIEKIIHDNKHRQRLFGLVGEYGMSNKVRNELGGNLSSEEGRIWFIAVDEEHPNRVLGFVSLMKHKSGCGHMKHLYLVEKGKASLKLEGDLIRACIEEARKEGLKELVAVDKLERSRVFETRGWTKGDQKGKSFCSFHYWLS